MNNARLAATLRTLDKHRQSGNFDKARAMRLLRNNARDILGHRGPDADALARAWFKRWEAAQG